MYYSTSLNATDEYIQHSLDHILLLTVMFPFDFYILSELWLLFTKFRLERKFKSESLCLKINSPNLITDLAHVDYAIFDKTGTLTTSQKHLSLLYFREGGSIYEFPDYGNFLENFWQSNHTENFLQTMNFDENLRQLPFQEAKILSCKSLIEEFHTHEGLNRFNGLLENLALTNSMNLSYSKLKQKHECKFRMKDERILFHFAKHLEYEFLNFYKKDGCLFYSLRVKNHVYNYKILGFYEQETDNVYNLFTIIYQDPRTNRYVLSCKGNASFLVRKLKFSKQEFDILDSILLTFHKKGFLDPLMYTRRTLSQQEADNFFEKFKNLQASLINQDEYLADLVNELLRDLDLLGLVGIEGSLEPESFELIKFLKSLCINSWILTGDSKQNAYNVASRIGVFDEAAEQYCIESENYEELVKQTKNILGYLSKSIKTKSESTFDTRAKFQRIKTLATKKSSNLKTIFDEKYDKYILINGRSFDIILKDEYLYSNLLFVCSVLRTIVGFNFSAQNKRLFVEIIKKRFSQKSTVMAIGDGFNDILMMNAADVSIEIAKKSKNQQSFVVNMMLGDFVVSNLRQVKELMMTHSGICFDKLQKLIEFTHYKSFIYGLSLFFYIFFDQYNSNCFYDVLLTAFYFGVFNVPTIILGLLLFKKIPERLREDLPELYYECKFQKKVKKISKSIFVSILEGFIISLGISLATFYFTRETIDPEGYTSNYNSLGLIHVYSFTIFIHAKVIKIQKKKLFFFYF